MPTLQPAPEIDSSGLSRSLISRLLRTDVVRVLRRALRPLPDDGRPLLIACSGGPDSTALLVGLAVLQPALGRPLHVACVDHGLRTSALDEADSVLACAARFGVAGTMLRVTVPAGASLQAQARVARYRALTTLARELDIPYLCVAHTRDDQTETMLMRWLGGAGTRGLSGMRPRSRRGPAGSHELILLRPLLSVSRAQITAFLEHASIATAPLPFADPSNRDPRYLRTRLRFEVLPQLRGLAPHLDQHLFELSDQLRADADCLDELAQQAVARLLALPPNSMDPGPAAVLVLPVRELMQLPQAILTRVLRQLVGTGLSARNLAALRGLCASTAGRKWLDLPGCGRVERCRDRLLIPRVLPAPMATSSPLSQAADPCQFTQILDGWEGNA